jgi:peroxiredoxin
MTKVPFFSLISSDGKTVTPWDFEQKNNLVIFFAHGSRCRICSAKIEELAGHINDFEFYNSKVIAVVLDPEEVLRLMQQEKKLPLILLADPLSKTISKFNDLTDIGENRPTILVADKYGEVYSSYSPAQETDLPGHEEIIADLKLLEYRCPECGIS